jgi:hypothetical protein
MVLEEDDMMGNLVMRYCNGCSAVVYDERDAEESYCFRCKFNMLKESARTKIFSLYTKIFSTRKYAFN